MLASHASTHDTGAPGRMEGWSLACGLLAKALYGQPDRPWLEGLVRNDVFRVMPFAGEHPGIARAHEALHAWTDSHRPGLETAAFEAIRDDHARLFVGPGRLLAAPWESVYMNKDRAVFQLETVAVKKWYQRFGLDLASDYNEPADHIGLEFSFLAHLAQLTAVAAGAGDQQEANRLVAAQRGFVEQHPGRWVAAWAQDVSRHARTQWYAALAALAEAVVADAQLVLGTTVRRVPKSGPFRIVTV